MAACQRLGPRRREGRAACDDLPPVKACKGSHRGSRRTAGPGLNKYVSGGWWPAMTSVTRCCTGRGSMCSTRRSQQEHLDATQRSRTGASIWAVQRRRAQRRPQGTCQRGHSRRLPRSDGDHQAKERARPAQPDVATAPLALVPGRGIRAGGAHRCRAIPHGGTSSMCRLFSNT